MDFEKEEHIRNLRYLYRDEGIEKVREMVEQLPIQHRTAADALIKELEEKERDSETLKLAREANDISRKANRWAILAVFIALVSAFISAIDLWPKNG